MPVEILLISKSLSLFTLNTIDSCKFMNKTIKYVNQYHYYITDNRSYT